MSLEQVRRALDSAGACESPAAAHVLVVLAWYADPDGGNVRPSVPRIARETGLGERTVQRALRHLEAAGLLVPERRSPGKATAYRLALHPRQPDTPTSQTPVTVTPSPVTVTPLPPSQCHPIRHSEVRNTEGAPARVNGGAPAGDPDQTAEQRAATARAELHAIAETIRREPLRGRGRTMPSTGQVPITAASESVLAELRASHQGPTGRNGGSSA